MYLKRFSFKDKTFLKTNYWFFLAPCILIGIFSALRWPSAWTATHALFDYSQGFSKRSFYGNFLSIFFDEKVSYLEITIVNFIIFCVWSSIIILLIRFIINKNLIDFKVCCLFFLSPAFIFQVHTIGYLEHVAFLLFSINLFVRNFYIHIILKFFIILLLPFIHEGLLLMITPVVILDTYLFLKDKSKKINLIITIFIIISIVGTCINSLSKKNNLELTQYEKYISKKAKDFNPRGNNIETLTNDILETLNLMYGYWTNPAHWTKLFMGIVFLMPLPIFLTFILIKSIREQKGKISKILLHGTIISCFSPAILILIAFDIWRWFALLQFTTFLTIFIFCLRERLTFKYTNYSFIFNCLFVITCLTSVPLFDEYEINKLPFYNHLENIWFIIKNNESFLQIPWHR